MRECKIHVLSWTRGLERRIINVLCDARPSTNFSHTFFLNSFFLCLNEINRFNEVAAERFPRMPFTRKKAVKKVRNDRVSKSRPWFPDVAPVSLCASMTGGCEYSPNTSQEPFKWELKMARHLLFSLAATVDSKEDTASDLPCAADTLPLKTLFNSDGRSASSELTNPLINTTCDSAPGIPDFSLWAFC